MQNFLQQLTPEFFDTLIIVIVVIGVALATVRLYKDFTRPPKHPPMPPQAVTPTTHEDEQS